MPVRAGLIGALLLATGFAGAARAEALTADRLPAPLLADCEARAEDAAGDAVAELFLLGREVEIVNDCDAGLLIYLEADDPAFARDAVFERLAARGRAISSERAFSSRFRFYAETTPSAGPAHRWPESAGAQSRIVEGRRISLMETRLAAPANRETGAFTLRLSCNPRPR